MPCFSVHLDAIKRNLTILAKTYIFPPEEEDAEPEDDLEERLEDVFAITCAELMRLRFQPQFFSSKDVEEEFWQEVHKPLDDLATMLTIFEEADEEEGELQGPSFEFCQDEVLPTRDMQRKLWEQYLHNRAPGSGADVSQFGTDGSVQILPHSAVRILGDMLDEIKSIIRDIETVSNST